MSNPEQKIKELEVKLTKAADAYNQSEDFGLNCEMKLSNASQRIKELEHNLSAKESQCDLYSQEIDANLKRIKELEAEVAAKDDLLRLALPIVRRDYLKSSEPLVEKINKALSTHTGKTLLAKIEAGEKCYKQLVALQHSRTAVDSNDGETLYYCPKCRYPKILHSPTCKVGDALSAYRATCEGGAK